jgi:hypothetical protein
MKDASLLVFLFSTVSPTGESNKKSEKWQAEAANKAVSSTGKTACNEKTQACKQPIDNSSPVNALQHPSLPCGGTLACWSSGGCVDARGSSGVARQPGGHWVVCRENSWLPAPAL